MHEETSGFHPLQTKNTCTQPDNAFRNTTQIYFNCQRANLQRGLNFHCKFGNYCSCFVYTDVLGSLDEDR